MHVAACAGTYIRYIYAVAQLLQARGRPYTAGHQSHDKNAPWLRRALSTLLAALKGHDAHVPAFSKSDSTVDTVIDPCVSAAFASICRQPVHQPVSGLWQATCLPTGHGLCRLSGSQQLYTVRTRATNVSPDDTVWNVWQFSYMGQQAQQPQLNCI